MDFDADQVQKIVEYLTRLASPLVSQGWDLAYRQVLFNTVWNSVRFAYLAYNTMHCAGHSDFYKMMRDNISNIFSVNEYEIDNNRMLMMEKNV